MSDTAVLVLIIVGNIVFITGFAVTMLFIVRRNGMERRSYGGLTRDGSVQSGGSIVDGGQ
ncbi:hypothetical protein [uncultured Microbacterium sp.]|uniref:hypothetical protein n=1 Tax=uncultured Microbacterium sp. TaxID=191216 RepID=UPI002633B88B|nr:hypothetical protein [uncultured Microbacterium sp.]